MSRESVCRECKNTNDEHKPWCSRYPGRHDRIDRPKCDDCGVAMSPFADTLTGESGWSCDSCGWST